MRISYKFKVGDTVRNAQDSNPWRGVIVSLGSRWGIASNISTRVPCYDVLRSEGYIDCAIYEHDLVAPISSRLIDSRRTSIVENSNENS